MRISDWSSDVCSSDLYVISNAGKLKQRGVEFDAQYDIAPGFEVHGALAYVRNRFHDYIGQCYAYTYAAGIFHADAKPQPGCSFLDPGDRKRLGSGTGVYVRLVLGVRRYI